MSDNVKTNRYSMFKFYRDFATEKEQVCHVRFVGQGKP